MKINIASQNNVKIDALRETIQDYGFLSGAEIVPVDAPSGVPDQPRSMGVIVKGAMNRARGAFRDCDLSFGIESGLMEVPGTKTGYMNTSICAIYDGKEFHLGMSPGVEFPKKVIELVLKEDINLSQAYHRLGMTDHPRIGSDEGIINHLTKGRVNRKEYMKHCIMMALVHLESSEFFR